MYKFCSVLRFTIYYAYLEVGISISIIIISYFYKIDNFEQMIMGLEVSQTEDPLNQAPQPANHYGAQVMEEWQLAH